MHRSKLFRALVIGGGMTAAALMGCGDEAGTNPQQTGEDTSTASQDDTTSTPDNSTTATDPTGTDDGATDTEDTNGKNSSTDDETTDTEDTNGEDSSTDEEGTEGSTDEEASADGELAPCFCNAEPECCEEVDGQAQAIEGFECCWGTSC